MFEELITKNSSWYSQYLIGKLRDSLLIARRKELNPYSISPQQASVLFILYNVGRKATLAEIAKHTGRGISSISIQLTRMEKDGLVTKTRERPKSAQLIFQLTKKGINIYNDCNKLVAYSEIFSVLTEEERQQLISTLKIVLINAEKYQSKESKFQGYLPHMG